MIEAVVDRLEGAPLQPRRRWPDAFKEQAALMPGANVSAIARRRSSVSMVVPQPDVSLEDKKTAAPIIEIVGGGLVIRVDATIDETHLQRVLRAVRSA